MAAQAQHKEVADGECLLLIQVSVGYSKTHFCDMWPGARARAGLVSFICALSVPGYLFNDTVILFFFLIFIYLAAPGLSCSTWDLRCRV